MTETYADNEHPPLPVLATPAKLAAVTRLADALVDRGHHRAAAVAIANAVTEPSRVRRQLDSPATFRVARGELDIVYTRAWSPAVVAYPSNTRMLPELVFPAADTDGNPPLAPPTASRDGAPELSLDVETPDDLIRVLSAEASFLERINPLASAIAAEGVREPLLVVPMTVSHRDGEKPRTLLVTADGSSRITAAHKLLGITPEEVVYGLSGDGRHLRQTVARVASLVSETGPEQLSPQDTARVRAIEVPVALVVGFTPSPHHPGDLASAVESRVAAVHVAPPRPWSMAARLDAQVNAAFQALDDAGELEPSRISWLAGYLTPDEARAEGFSDQPDVRAAELLRVFVTRHHAARINKSLRELSVPAPTPKDRAALAAEAALRSVRTPIASPSLDASRNLLQHSYTIDIFRTANWKVEFEADPDDLVRVACAEVEIHGPGRAACQLSAMALYWMAVRNLVRRTTRGGERDRRDIATVIGLMMRSEHGLRIFHRIVVDSRAGKWPRRVGPTGRFLVDKASRERRPIDEAWLRKTFGGPVEREISERPEVQLDSLRDLVRDAAVDLVNAVGHLKKPTGVGGPLVLQVGLPGQFVKEVLQLIADAQAALVHYGYLAEQRAVAEGVDSHDSDDLGFESESS